MIRKNQRLEPANIKNVEITGGFWKERFDVFQTVTVPDVMDKFEHHRQYGGALRNFRMLIDGKNGPAAGQGLHDKSGRTIRDLRGPHYGPPWYDALIGETIRGIADLYTRRPDAAVEERIDSYIELMDKAQEAIGDGYLHTYNVLNCPEHRLGRNGGDILWQHDLYTAGAIVEAGVHHYRATGKTRMLAVACKFANYLVSQIGPEPRDNIVPAHPLAEEAFLHLYELFAENPGLQEKTGVPVNEGDYLELVKFWLDMRGRHENRKSYPRYMGEYAQDHVPLLEQNEAVGHAVRAVLLYAGMSEYANITGDERYAAAAKRLWDNITLRKLHISGGVGAVHNEEKFGYEYQLPNTAYLETCAGAAMVFFARSMFLREGRAEYMDVLERALYNGVLPGVSLKGDEYFYENPLSSGGQIRRWEWHGCPCCPPMFLKVMGEFPSYLYSSNAEGIWVNLYAASRARIEIGDRGEAELVQETNFPWGGEVTLSLRSCPGKPFSLNLRIPEYAASFTVTVNGSTIGAAPRDTTDKGYFRIERDWKAGDKIGISIGLEARLMAAHPFVRHDFGKVAIERGPLLYCVEETDNIMDSLVIPESVRLTATEVPGLPGITGLGFVDTLYRDVLAIPYYVWANRVIGKMDVWLDLENYRVPDGDWTGKLYRPYTGG
ncbi:MAG: glycoside hydrolase family 127 protein [Treponema sp.]|jgi:DUF1680 family protein|nr:glycoside hydrolase family 127 protein [Treponema sp.]